MAAPWQVPLYYQAELARYVNLGSQRLYRWVRGQHAWLPSVEAADEYTFGHLVELAIIREMMTMGIQPRRIRRAYEELRAKVGEFPFARNKLRELCGMPVWVQEMQELGGVAGQLVFEEMALQVGRHIRWSGEMPIEYRPLADLDVVLTPERACGVPIVEQGIPTQILHRAWKAEDHDVARVAWAYGIKPEDVEDAVRFEEHFQPKRAA